MKDDNIARAAAVDIVRFECGEFHGISGRIIEKLDALPPAQQWIPCDMRTPKHVEESYWICTDTGYQCQCRWTNDVWGLGASDKWAWKLLDIPQYSRVVAWMPLPELYHPKK